MNKVLGHPPIRYLVDLFSFPFPSIIFFQHRAGVKNLSLKPLSESSHYCLTL